MHLIIDNGSYNIKAGFASGPLLKVQNTLTKTKDGIIHIGNEHIAHTNLHSGILFKRPYEQGHLTSWETEKAIWDYTIDQLTPQKELDPAETHLTLTEAPFQLPQLSINTDQIVFEEYGFNEYYRCPAASLVPWVDFEDNSKTAPNDFMLVIDSGYNATWIIPVLYQTVYWQGVRKLPVGGKLLNGILKELISFRHYDVLEEPILINTIKEQTCFLAQDFNKALASRDKYMCEFILPDFKTTMTGYLRDKNTVISPDTQSLKLLDERFTVPESLYHPEIIFDNNSTTANSGLVQNSPIKNLTDLVVESIMACPETARPLLLANISIVGGSAYIPNFTNRLVLEITKELPLHWFVRVRQAPKDSKLDEMSWMGGVGLTNDEIINDVSISKKEYFEHGSNWCQKQFGFKNTV
ncbi:actin-related protein [Suhomyces tanzawaensis NRRL Y-17324]|uniref:Actin-like protein ARP6 n=1 Tax=Suhomyces tanzawaensis NRRL Y-17324 TaxID=984487 RepID=A0A1E4SD71_9ASCO|nr:actin-related protein [Suhomyces tanzawaensis NRRL Y-17324]ODV77467.1 actin-related protein [Suhomyces tanzawaensis NRRL Y-17324]